MAMSNPFNGCTRGVFAVWTPAELSLSHFSMLRPDSTVSHDLEHDHTFASDKSSLQKMETIDSDESSIRESATKTAFQGCRRGVFALDSWNLEGDALLDGNADKLEGNYSPSNASVGYASKRFPGETTANRESEMAWEEVNPADLWNTHFCTRGVFAVRQLWDTSLQGQRDFESLNGNATANSQRK